MRTEHTEAHTEANESTNENAIALRVMVQMRGGSVEGDLLDAAARVAGYGDKYTMALAAVMPAGGGGKKKKAKAAVAAASVDAAYPMEEVNEALECEYSASIESGGDGWVGGPKWYQAVPTFTASGANPGGKLSKVAFYAAIERMVAEGKVRVRTQKEERAIYGRVTQVNAKYYRPSEEAEKRIRELEEVAEKARERIAKERGKQGGAA